MTWVLKKFNSHQWINFLPTIAGARARRAASNTGELSAFYHAVDWTRTRRKSLEQFDAIETIGDKVICVTIYRGTAIAAHRVPRHRYSGTTVAATIAAPL